MTDTEISQMRTSARVAIVADQGQIDAQGEIATISRYISRPDIRLFNSIQELIEVVDSADCSTVQTRSQATRGQSESATWFPDLGIVHQTWSDQFQRHDVLRLVSRFPLTRWICRYETWCDGDGRNRHIWPAPFRVSYNWYELRLKHEVDILNNLVQPLSATASPAEIFEYEYRHTGQATMNASHARQSLQIAIVSPDKTYGDSLERLCNALGYRVLKSVSPRNISRLSETSLYDADAILWDCDPWSDRQPERLIDFRKSVQRHVESNDSAKTRMDDRHEDTRMPIIFGMMGMPLADDARNPGECGILAIIPKLAPAALIDQHLSEIATSRSAAR